MEKQDGEVTGKPPGGRAGWRSELTCGDCRRWEGKPPVPVREARGLLWESGLRDFELSHACHVRSDADGIIRHIPITVLRTGGVEIELIPGSN